MEDYNKTTPDRTSGEVNLYRELLDAFQLLHLIRSAESHGIMTRAELACDKRPQVSGARVAPALLLFIVNLFLS